MRLKGLTKEVIDIALEEYEEGVEERLRKLIEKKYLRIMTDEKGVNRAKNALVRYGYDYSDINKVFRELESEYGEADE